MPYTLSPSSLSLLKDCPRCFWLQFNKDIRRPDSIFPSLPSGMDRILKEHFDRFMRKGELPPELQALDGEVKLFDDEALLKGWRDNRKGIRWQDDAGNLFRGAVDNILQKGEKLIVLDYKTRGYPVKEDTPDYYRDQLDIYNLLLRKNGCRTEDYAYLIFYHPKGVHQNGNVDFHAELVKMQVSIANAERIFREALSVLEGPLPQQSAACGFCRWADACSQEKG
ncbi:MAG TPA: PD-(D/E)XK nuclease family protein [Candidatus Nanoarchaeia archaeon]|nr:PD-(D/E)XK nuclease family protein [Candidatus Nanoarchaeia archaeon]